MESGDQVQMATPAREIPPPKREAKAQSSNEINHSNFVEASVLTSANRLVEEIKSAYAKILQEKEEQISQLKEEIIDLRMLVRILEDTSKQPTMETEQKKTGPYGATTVADRYSLQGDQTSAQPDSADYLFGDFQSRDI